ncbi:unnamed protein product, partial [Ectocarpus sp. 12 AP-2014]
CRKGSAAPSSEAADAATGATAASPSASPAASEEPRSTLSPPPLASPSTPGGLVPPSSSLAAATKRNGDREGDGNGEWDGKNGEARPAATSRPPPLRGLPRLPGERSHPGAGLTPTEQPPALPLLSADCPPSVPPCADEGEASPPCRPSFSPPRCPPKS